MVSGAGAAGVGAALMLTRVFGLDPRRVLLLERGAAVGESFRLPDHTARPNRYEVLFRSGNSLGGGAAFCRDIEGHVVRMPDSTVVRRGSNLSRNPSGNAESKVSCATFPVGHYVNHRVARLNNAQQGFVFCFLGDEQSSPHFMRYSGLTGAAIGGTAHRRR